MKFGMRFATTVFAIAALTIPFRASAISVKEFNAQTRDQQAQFISTTVDKIVTDVAKVDPVLSKSIRDYFGVTPSGKDQPPGLLAFGASLKAITDLGDKGKLDMDKVKTEGILLAIIKTNLMNKQAQNGNQSVAPVGGETVYQFLLLEDNAQVKEIQRLCGNVVTDFSKKTDGDKPLPENTYQDRRQVANFLRALFLRGSTDVSDSMTGDVTSRIKEIAGTSPFADVVDSLRTVVFEYFDKFKSASIVNDSDADQQTYFLNQYKAYFQQSTDDYNKQMAQVRQKADALEKQLDQEKQYALHKLRELCGETVLSDGRRVLHVEKGESSDVAMKKFQQCIAWDERKPKP